MVSSINDSDIKLFYSTTSVNGINYLGGARSTEEVSDNILHNLLSKTTPDEQASGIIKVRCFYVYNDNPIVYLKNPAIFVVSDTTSPSDFIEVGWGTSAIGTGLSGATDGSIEQSVAFENDSPEDVQFFKDNFRSGGAILDSDLPPKKGKACWIRYTSVFGAQDFPYDTFRLRIVGDNIRPNIPERTGPPLQPQIVFDVFGECSSDDDFAALASTMIPQNPHFFVTVGNNNIQSNPAYFLGVMGTASLSKMLLALGPADVINSTVTNAYLNAIAAYTFVPNIQQRYYSKNYGNVHILVMDTSGAIPFINPSPQYDFVVNDLRVAFTDPNIDWIFVATNASMHGSQTTSAIRHFSADLQKTYHDLFTKNGVLVVFQGTFHYYERTKVLKYNPADLSAPQIFAYDGPDNYHISGKKSFVDGCIFITVGTGGESHDIIPTPSSGSAARGTLDFGFVKVIVDNRLDQPKVSIRFYETSRSASIFFDEVTVTRTG